MSKILVRHVVQPNSNTCVHACLSMVTWIAVEELLNRLGGNPAGVDAERTILTENGIFPAPIPNEYGLHFDGVYFMTVPSLNEPGHAHRIVVQFKDDDAWEVLDPNEGRPGKLFYSRSALTVGAQQRLLWWGEIVHLQPMFGHLGWAELQKRYAVARKET